MPKPLAALCSCLSTLHDHENAMLADTYAQAHGTLAVFPQAWWAVRCSDISQSLELLLGTPGSESRGLPLPVALCGNACCHCAHPLSTLFTCQLPFHPPGAASHGQSRLARNQLRKSAVISNEGAGSAFSSTHCPHELRMSTHPLSDDNLPTPT